MLSIGAADPIGLWGQIWKWLDPTLTAGAAVVAIFVFIQAGLALRRRPEIRFTWAVSNDGKNFTEWSESDKKWSCNVGERLFVRITSTNVGDASSGQSIWNL